MNLSLTVKFNLAFLAVFAAGFAATGIVAERVLQENAVQTTVRDASLMIEAATAVHNYTSDQVTPLLATQIKYAFVPQSIPAYSAIESLLAIEKKFPGFSYKHAMLDPTNPRDRATDWETDVIRRLHDHPELPELIGERATPSGPSLYIARPTRIDSAACLECHSTPAAAPRTMLDKYGPANGFNWPLHETIGAQVVSVPMSLPLEHARTVWRTFMASFAAVFGCTLIALNLMVHFLVTKRLTALSRTADEVSLGKLDTAAFSTRGGDEIASLAVSFNRMRTSLVEALRMLGA
ncbi:c-type heme family protein [Paraburkholderia sp.]|jgi:HAMP domain-containing protein|uniref:c-type heme family protein n=1 Tax=Paraburkholderia sp. TaxID=1926495 RepID=UPI002F3E767C